MSRYHTKPSSPIIYDYFTKLTEYSLRTTNVVANVPDPDVERKQMVIV